MNGSITLLVAGITALFGEGLLSLGRLASARRAGRGGQVALSLVTIALAAVVCVAALVAGFIAMTHK